MKKIGLIIGSLRSGSFNKSIAKAMSQLFPADYQVELVTLDGIDMYNQDLDDNQQAPQSWVDFRAKIASLDGVIFFTPEYNRSVPAVLKNALDVGSRPYGESVWDGKPAAIVSASPGAISGFGANHHLRQSLVFLNMPVLAQPEMYLGNVTNFIAEDGSIENPDTLAFFQSFIDAYLAWFEKTK